jgi:hypothetical protein
MKIEEFWNQAFLMSLSRVSPEQAKADADLATDLCIKHWQERKSCWAHPNIMRWKDQDIVDVPKGVRAQMAASEDPDQT